MKEEDLLADLGPAVLFFLATILFAVGWLQTDKGLYLGGALLTGVGTIYLLYRLGRLYIQ